MSETVTLGRYRESRGDPTAARRSPRRAAAAFAGASEPGGPSLLALWEMPQLANDAVMLRRGHPGKGKKRTTVVRSVRLPETLWKELERAARAKHLNLHQAMRAAPLGCIRRAS